MICSANQWTGLYMIETSVMKELKKALLHASLLKIELLTQYIIISQISKNYQTPNIILFDATKNRN